MSISLLLEMAVSGDPERTAVVSDDMRLTTQELSDLAECGSAGIAGPATEPVGRGSLLRTFRFPDQVTTISEGQEALDALSIENVGKVEQVNLNECTIKIRTGPSLEKARGEQPFPTALVGWDNIYLKPLEYAALEVGRDLLAALDLDQLGSRVLREIGALRQVLAEKAVGVLVGSALPWSCLLYTSPSPRDRTRYRMPASA